MSSSMVLTIEDGMMKRSYGHDCSRPKFAIMNPKLTYSLPAYQTASGAADIMMHTMERYFTPTDTDTILTDRIAEGLMISVRDAAQVAVKDPENYDARLTEPDLHLSGEAGLDMCIRQIREDLHSLVRRFSELMLPRPAILILRILFSHPSLPGRPGATL